VNAARRFLARLWRWLNYPGPIVLGSPPPEEPARFFLTGPDLIERIVRAIELNQSVVLSGPRGCGKSHCVFAAIEAAQAKDRNVIQGHVFLQGNREIPRDYLVEDEIAFKTVTTTTPGSAPSTAVVPFRRSSPLFAFARRNASTGEPLHKGGRVECGSGDDLKGDCKRFALFLDEINRFSDGVLDSLLSVLEERKAVLAGKEFTLPVVVCMTMNPPGYDGSARKLSPPLAARISRTYRLCTADLDTLSDQIIRRKMRKLKDVYNAERAERKAADPNAAEPPQFPEISADIIRKVGLVTLLCWGDITGKKAGTEYLTPGTQDLLREVMANDQVVKGCMSDLTGLCQFGPDGRAGSDWLTTAIGVALSDAQRNGKPQAVLRPDHLIDTVLESVAHKIYDSFSQASRPDLTAKKERAVETLCRQAFNRPFFTELVRRKVDDPDQLQPPFAPHLGADFDALHDAFTGAGVVSRADVEPWLSLARKLPAGAASLHELLRADSFLVEADPDADLSEGFAQANDDALARKLATLTGPLAGALRGLFTSPRGGARPSLGPRRVPLAEEVAASYAARCVGVDRLLALCDKHKIRTRTIVLKLVREVETLWALTPQRGKDSDSEKKFIKELNDLTEDWRGRHRDDATLIRLLEAIAELLRGRLLRAVAAAREAEAATYKEFFGHLRARLRTNIKRLRKEAAAEV
jgi:MoxR-like ATPase